MKEYVGKLFKQLERPQFENEKLKVQPVNSKFAPAKFIGRAGSGGALFQV